MPLLVSRGLPFEPKSRLYHAQVRSVMLCGSDAWLVKKENVIRLEKKNPFM